ncbi:MAG: hypothetical protein DSY80_08945 [Desulfocapsa sp.]|nr:MAG: hypothetical protein DSY80_08945 [Desulfocapsa sp.]
MNGYPKHLNTKADYEYIEKHYPDEYEEEMRKLWNTKDNYFAVRTLGGNEIGINDERMKVVESIANDGTIERVQMRLEQDPNSKMVRLGFSVNENISAPRETGE